MSVRLGLLALLSEGPSHGYQLKTAFEDRTGGVWTLNVGQVYTTLDRLHADGLITPVASEHPSTDGRERRSWQITPAGKAAVADWFDETAIDRAPPRDELLVKVLFALERSTSEALAVIDRHRSEIYRLLQSERRASERESPTTADETARMAAHLMAEAVAARREADLTWLDRCEAQILSRATPPQPSPSNRTPKERRR